jgi:tetratricopeptide (TPR) repeat protein
VCELRLNELSAALAHLQHCQILQSDYAWLYPLQGYINGQLHSFAAAEKDFATAVNQLDKKPASTEVNREEVDNYKLHARYGLFVNWAGVHSLQGNFSQALKDLQIAIGIDPRQFAAYQKLGQVYHEQARHQLQAGYLAAISLPPLLAAVVAGVAHGQHSQSMDQAEQQLDRAIRLKNDLAALYSAQSQIRLERGQDLKGALSDIEKAIQINRINRVGGPIQAECFYAKARVHFQAKDYSSTLGACDDALELCRDQIKAFWLRGRAALLLGKHQLADESYTLYLDSGGEADVSIFRERAFARAGYGNFIGAFNDAWEALTLEPNDSPTQALCGWYCLHFKEGPQALRYFEQAIRLNPMNADAHTGRGLSLLLTSKDYRAAVEAGRTALDIAPQDPRILYNAASIYMGAAMQDEALTLGDSRIRQSLSLAYQDEAVGLIRRAYANTPQDQRGTYKDRLLRDPVLERIRPRLSLLGWEGRK